MLPLGSQTKRLSDRLAAKVPAESLCAKMAPASSSLSLPEVRRLQEFSAPGVVALYMAVYVLVLDSTTMLAECQTGILAYSFTGIPAYHNAG